MFESHILHPFNSNNNYVNAVSPKVTVNVIPMFIDGFVINMKGSSCILQYAPYTSKSKYFVSTLWKVYNGHQSQTWS